MGSSPDGKPKAGLRERKKPMTRAEIQRQALRLFRERGYEATTVAQIAEAPEVSESTFFRYFPTKEDVVLWDELDPPIFEAFSTQPAELGPIRALRYATSSPGLLRQSESSCASAWSSCCRSRCGARRS